MIYTEPSPLEHDLGSQLAGVAVGNEPSDLPELFAEALAAHRQRCIGFVASVLEGLERDGMSEHAIDRMRDGWTPEQVHRLIDAHRRLLRGVAAAREIIPKALAGTR